MRLEPESPESAAELANSRHIRENDRAVPNLVKISQPIATAGGVPIEAMSSVQSLTVANMQNLHPAALHTQRHFETSWPSRSGGIDIGDYIVEERDADEVEPEDAPWRRRWRDDSDDSVGDFEWDRQDHMVL